MATVFTGQLISPEEILGDTGAAQESATEPGSSDETQAFLAAMGATKRNPTD